MSEWVRHAWHPARSPLCAIYKGINALYWPSIINYQLPTPHSVLYWPSTQLHHLVTQRVEPTGSSYHDHPPKPNISFAISWIFIRSQIFQALLCQRSWWFVQTSIAISSSKASSSFALNKKSNLTCERDPAVSSPNEETSPLLRQTTSIEQQQTISVLSVLKSIRVEALTVLQPLFGGSNDHSRQTF